MWPFKKKEKSPEALEMWDTLKDDYTGDPEFDPSLQISAAYALSLSHEDLQVYLADIVRRRKKAHNRNPN